MPNHMLEMFFFHKYCTAFYGSQILPLLNNCMDDVYIAWRIAMRKNGGFPGPFIVIYCHILLVLWTLNYGFSKRCIKFIKMALNSNNLIVRTIIKVGLNGTHSIMGSNWRHLRSKYGMQECHVMKSWDEKCKNECESVRVYEKIREMCSWRDRCDMTLFNKEECSTIIEFLRTSKFFSHLWGLFTN